MLSRDVGRKLGARHGGEHGRGVHDRACPDDRDVRRDTVMSGLLVIVAHPDDETFGTGSVIASAARAGVQVTVCCATRRGRRRAGRVHRSRRRAPRPRRHRRGHGPGGPDPAKPAGLRLGSRPSTTRPLVRRTRGTAPRQRAPRPRSGRPRPSRSRDHHHRRRVIRARHARARHRPARQPNLSLRRHAGRSTRRLPRYRPARPTRPTLDRRTRRNRALLRMSGWPLGYSVHPAWTFSS